MQSDGSPDILEVQNSIFMISESLFAIRHELRQTWRNWIR